jgi:hypothetical protein
MGRLAKVVQGQSQPGLKAFKKGGAVHTDEAQDKKLIKKMMAQEEKKEKGMMCGGKVKGKK